MAGGFLADRFSKRSVMLGVKVFEMLIMSLVFAGLVDAGTKICCSPAFFSWARTARFSARPNTARCRNCCRKKNLSWGNGILELGTFMAIILGTVAAALMSQTISRTPMDVRRRPHRAGGNRIFCMPRHHKNSGGESAEKIQRQFPRRNLAAIPRHARRPSALARAVSATLISISSARCCC